MCACVCGEGGSGDGVVVCLFVCLSVVVFNSICLVVSSTIISKHSNEL